MRAFPGGWARKVKELGIATCTSSLRRGRARSVGLAGTPSLVFGRFLYRGLQGKANMSGNSDQVVTLGKLFRYLNAGVSDWVKAHRDDEQTPMLFGKDGRIDIDKLGKKDNFALVAVPAEPGDETPPGSGTEPPPHWDEIAKLWEQHEKLRSGGAPRRSPIKWQEYQYRLLYLEQLALAGKVGGEPRQRASYARRTVGR